MALTQELTTTSSYNIVDPKNLWYVADRRIETRVAVQQACRVAERISAGLKTDDETTLFTAMHTCACQAKKILAEQYESPPPELQEWVSRWKVIREHLVEENLGLVYTIVGRLNHQHLDDEEMVSEAMLALSKAIDRFNPWKGFRFSTYACNVILRSLMRRGRRETHYRRMFPVSHETTLEKPGFSDEQTELYVERLHHIMERNLGRLSELERWILNRRYPIRSRKRLTFQEIANQVSLSKERVRQLHNAALSKIRRVLRQDPVLR